MKLLPKAYYGTELTFVTAVVNFENKLYTVKEFINYLRQNQEDLLQNQSKINIIVFDDMICKYNINLYGETKMTIEQWFLMNFPVRIPYMFVKSKLYVNEVEVQLSDPLRHYSETTVYCYTTRSKNKAMQDIQDKNKYAEYYKLSIIHNFKKKLGEII